MKIILDTGAHIPVPAEFEPAVQKLVMSMMFPAKVQKRKAYTVPRIAKEWTMSEEEIVRTEFSQGIAAGRRSGAVCQDIGAKLNRTAASIASRANTLGLIAHRV